MRIELVLKTTKKDISSYEESRYDSKIQGEKLDVYIEKFWNNSDFTLTLSCHLWDEQIFKSKIKSKKELEEEVLGTILDFDQSLRKKKTSKKLVNSVEDDCIISKESPLESFKIISDTQYFEIGA